MRSTTDSTTQLTPRQLQLLKIVAGAQENQCYSPTIGELACELNISRSTIFGHIAELRRKGLLCGYPNKARSLKLSSRAQELLSCLAEQHTNRYPDQAPGIPLSGKVAAGLPLEAIENIEYLSLNSCFGSSTDIFALKVKGDSMLDDDIREGDYVICRRTCLADDGQIVIAMVDDENATLKRFYKEKNQARLQPANENYRPIYSNNCRVAAVVIGLIRKL